MRNNKALPLVPVSVKKYLYSFYTGDTWNKSEGEYITALVKDYLRDPDRYLMKSPSLLVIKKLLDEKDVEIFTISLNEDDYALLKESANNQLRDIKFQGAWILLSIAVTLKQLKVKEIVINNNRVTFQTK